VKEGIKDLVYSRYADLERMLNENIGITGNASEIIQNNNKRPKTQMHALEHHENNNTDHSNYQLDE